MNSIHRPTILLLIVLLSAQLLSVISCSAEVPEDPNMAQVTACLKKSGYLKRKPDDYKLTGNQLFDELGQALNAFTIDESKYLTLYDLKSDFSQHFFSKIANDYSDQPEYWELCCFLEENYYTSLPGTANIQAVLNLIEQAKARDALSIGLLKTKYRLVQKLYNEDIDNANNQDRETLLSLNTKYEQDSLDILNKMVEQFPDDANGYYERAYYYFSYGEFDLGMADLKQGNRTENYSDNYLFPMRFMMEQIMAGKPAGSFKSVAIISLWESDYISAKLIRYKERVRDALVAVNLNGDIDIYEEWHQFVCRFGRQPEPEQVSKMLTCCEMLKILADHYLEMNEAVVDASKRESLELLIESKDSLRYILRDNNLPMPGLNDNNTCQIIERKYGPYAENYLRLIKDIEMVKVFELYLEATQDVHYPELKHTTALEKYALTEEHVRPNGN